MHAVLPKKVENFKSKFVIVINPLTVLMKYPEHPCGAHLAVKSSAGQPSINLES